MIKWIDLRFFWLGILTIVVQLVPCQQTFGQKQEQESFVGGGGQISWYHTVFAIKDKETINLGNRRNSLKPLIVDVSEGQKGGIAVRLTYDNVSFNQGKPNKLFMPSKAWVGTSNGNLTYSSAQIIKGCYDGNYSRRKKSFSFSKGCSVILYFTFKLDEKKTFDGKIIIDLSNKSRNPQKVWDLAIPYRVKITDTGGAHARTGDESSTPKAPIDPPMAEDASSSSSDEGESVIASDYEAAKNAKSATSLLKFVRRYNKQSAADPEIQDALRKLRNEYFYQQKIILDQEGNFFKFDYLNLPGISSDYEAEVLSQSSEGAIASAKLLSNDNHRLKVQFSGQRVDIKLKYLGHEISKSLLVAGPIHASGGGDQASDGSQAGQGKTGRIDDKKSQTPTRRKTLAQKAQEAFDKAEKTNAHASYLGFIDAYHAKQNDKTVKALIGTSQTWLQEKIDSKAFKRKENTFRLQIPDLPGLATDYEFTGKDKNVFSRIGNDFKFELEKETEVEGAIQFQGISISDKLTFNTMFAPIEASFMFNEAKELIISSLSGGQPQNDSKKEYILRINYESGPPDDIPIKRTEMEKTGSKWKATIPLSDQFGGFFLASKEVTFSVTDDRKLEVYTDEKPHTISPPSWVWVGLIGFLVLLISGSILWRIFRKKRTEREEEEAEKNREERQRIREQRDASSSFDQERPMEETAHSQTSGNSQQRKIKIQPKTAELPAASASMLATRLSADAERALLLGLSKAEPNSYFRLDLNNLWRDSKVSTVYMRDKFVNRLHEFVFQEHQSLHQKREENIPEIGGYILGYKHQDKQTGTYTLLFERLVTIEPEKANVYQIEFGPRALSKLDDAINDHYGAEQYKNLGWFHTHPGHGLFLSAPDLRICNSSFIEEYHIAMEIDSVHSEERNPHFEMGIFSRNSSGNMNNNQDLLNNWFQWDQIQQWLTRT